MLNSAVQLLATTSPRTLHRNDQQFALAQFVGLAADAAALSIRAGDDVFESLRLLEFGRGVIASLHFDVRSDVVQLQNEHPELAKKFKLLRDELDSPDLGRDQRSVYTDTQRSMNSRISRLYEASKEFDEILELIRKKNGFERFLRGPSNGELKRIAVHGPIVFINISHFGGDAFLITHDNMRHLPLPTLEYSDVESKSELLVNTLKADNLRVRGDTNRCLKSILEWLWDFIVEPIFESLGFRDTPSTDDAWPHVWWIPVGRLSVFPIHAAGYHSVSGRSTLDRVISSYAPTARALDHARSRIENHSQEESQILMLAMPNTPNQNDLPFVEEEVKVIDNLLPSSINRTILSLPTKSQMVENIGNCFVVHFACHGIVDSDPSKSRMLFTDWGIDPFTVADMSRENLNKAQLAYISACHAANNRNFELLDESIHMAGACQLAGFPMVIGSLWQIHDELAPMVAEHVYQEMLTEGLLDVRKAARGLHFAIRKIKGRSREWTRSKPALWCGPYIHVGA
jgi:hypothetical protein